MAMIKELLTPEEFSSVAPNLLIRSDSMEEGSARRHPNDDMNDRIRKHLSDRLKSTSLYSNRLAESDRQQFEQHPHQRQKRNLSVKEQLLMKQQALDFFFMDQPTQTRTVTTHRDLAIELRSGYCRSASSLGDESKLLKPSGFGAFDRVFALLEMVGINLWSWLDPPDEQVDEDGGKADVSREFAEQSCDKLAPSLGWPYGRMRNIEAMRVRLQLDNQLDKVVAMRRVQRQVVKDLKRSRFR